MDNAIKYANFIKRIFSTSKIIRKKLLSSSNSMIIKAICEILLNIYFKTLILPDEDLKKLKLAKLVILKLINKKTSAAKRKELIISNSELLVPINKVIK